MREEKTSYAPFYAMSVKKYLRTTGIVLDRMNERIDSFLLKASIRPFSEDYK